MRIFATMTSGRRDKPQRGFTLIELIFVTIIIGLIFSLAIGNLDFLVPTYSLRSAARKIGALMKTANTQAATSGKDVYMEYDLTNGRYWLLVALKEGEEEEGSSPFEGPRYKYHPLFHSTLPEGVEFVDIYLSAPAQDKDLPAYERKASGMVSIRISPFGSTNHHIVNLKNHQEEKMAIKLNGLTGIVTFYDEYLEAPLYIQEGEYGW
jgi:prepilin-type N-terminal cleavage/methylation domain-containing protein